MKHFIKASRGTCCKFRGNSFIGFIGSARKYDAVGTTGPRNGSSISDDFVNNIFAHFIRGRGRIFWYKSSCENGEIYTPKRRRAWLILPTLKCDRCRKHTLWPKNVDDAV